MFGTPVPLHNTHVRTNFSCGEGSLDHYIQNQVGQDLRRRLCTCFVLADKDNEVIGYYTLSSSSIAQKHIPDHISKKMPPAYKDLPVTLLGRLAVSKDQKGNRLGELLLLDALKRCHDISKTSIGSMAVVLDPINNSEAFYEKYGFIRLPGSGKMFLPMKTIASLFN